MCFFSFDDCDNTTYEKSKEAEKTFALWLIHKWCHLKGGLRGTKMLKLIVFKLQVEWLEEEGEVGMKMKSWVAVIYGCPLEAPRLGLASDDSEISHAQDWDQKLTDPTMIESSFVLPFLPIQDLLGWWNLLRLQQVTLQCRWGSLELETKISWWCYLFNLDHLFC